MSRLAGSVAHVLCSVAGGRPGTEADSLEALRIYTEGCEGDALGASEGDTLGANEPRP